MLKIIGAIMICSGSAAIGISAANRLTLRINVLNTWMSVLDMMHSEIKFLLTPINELMIKCKRNVKEPVKKFFDECMEMCSKQPDISFCSAWSSALGHADYMELTAQEKQILLDLGNALGRYDANEQAVRIEHLRKVLEGRAKAAECEKSRLGKLYGSLGVACGIALVIVFV